MINLASKEKLLIIGDFNFADLKWGKTELLDYSHLFVQCINDNFIVQCVEDCTGSKNVLDLILTSEENMVENLSVGEHFGTSDHQIIRWDFSACKEVLKKTCEFGKRHDYFKADYDKMREDAREIDWARVMKGEDIETRWEGFKNSLETLRVKWVPLKLDRNKKCKWVNRAVVRARRAKIKAWNIYQSKRTDQNLLKYKAKLRESVAQNRVAKRDYERRLANDVKSISKSSSAYS